MLVCRAAPIGWSPLTALPLDPFPPSAVVPIGLSLPCVVPLPPWFRGGGGTTPCVMRVFNVRLHAARHKAAGQQSQNKRLLSDIAMGAFRCNKRCTQKSLHCGLDQVSVLKLTCRMPDPFAEQFVHISPPPPPGHCLSGGGRGGGGLREGGKESRGDLLPCRNEN